MASVRHCHVSVKTGGVTVIIRGKSSNKDSELRKLAELLGEVLDTLKYNGEFTLMPQRNALPASAATKGLSLNGVTDNVINVAYQPKGNDSRSEYHLRVGPRAMKMFPVLKEYIGTSYTGKSKPVKASSARKGQKSKVEEVQKEQAASVATTKPSDKPDLWYVDDPTWLSTCLDLLSAKTDDKDLILKSDVTDVIFGITHYKEKFGLGPVVVSLKRGGYLKEVEDDIFKLYTKPKVEESQVARTSSASTKGASSKKKPRTYVGDKVWFTQFVTDLLQLTDKGKTAVAGEALKKFVRQRLEEGADLRTIGAIIRSLKTREIIHQAGKTAYKLHLQNAEKAIEKAVAIQEQVSAEQKEKFSKFSPVHLPQFALGVFSNRDLKERFLQAIREQEEITTKFLRGLIYGYWKVSPTAIEHMIRFLVVKGYLVRKKPGIYALGPETESVLGIKPKAKAAEAQRGVVENADPGAEALLQTLGGVEQGIDSVPVESKTGTESFSLVDDIEKLPLFSQEILSDRNEARAFFRSLGTKGIRTKLLAEKMVERFDITDGYARFSIKDFVQFNLLEKVRRGWYQVPETIWQLLEQDEYTVQQEPAQDVIPQNVSDSPSEIPEVSAKPSAQSDGADASQATAESNELLADAIKKANHYKALADEAENKLSQLQAKVYTLEQRLEQVPAEVEAQVEKRLAQLLGDI